MNIKMYLDYFDEISHLPREEQFDLLDKAQDLVLSESKVSKFKLVSFFAPLLSLVAMIGIGYVIFGYSILLFVIAGVFGLLLSRVAVNETNTYLLSRGLRRVMEGKLN
ncbi:hypothetical protein EYS14_04730 [Alteromonadaceae bacterium M269]|nr:hypothetical protein EYS14_04730 [Alteromonadaceae bacterium M269]